MPTELIAFTIAVVVGVLWFFIKPVIKQRAATQTNEKELDDQFAVEVLYQGVAIADLSDRRVIEMFWSEYQIVPRSSEAKVLIENDDLWDGCVFDFRDPVSGDVCTSGFVGGNRPFVRDGKVSLRALYFDGSANTTNPEQVGDGGAEEAV